MGTEIEYNEDKKISDAIKRIAYDIVDGYHISTVRIKLLKKYETAIKLETGTDTWVIVAHPKNLNNAMEIHKEYIEFCKNEKPNSLQDIDLKKEVEL